jgi:hypothetical protein
MAGKTVLFGKVAKLGVKYGPLAYGAIKHGKGPAKEFAQRQLARVNARKAALTHADGLTDGSAILVWRDDQQIWVVFNGDEPVASHPAVETPLGSLIQGYDLTKRIRPTNDQRPKTGPLKAIRRKR